MNIREIKEDEGFKICKREAKLALIIWGIFFVIVIGITYLFGAYRITDPLNFPFGLPTYILFGGYIVPAVFVCVVYIIVKKFLKHIDFHKDEE